jgi:4-hydroxybenzoate polyprenyltransferase
MFFLDIIYALGFSLLVVLIFSFLFKRRGPWPFLVFLLLVFLAAWAGGVWFSPADPLGSNWYWLPFLISALIIALLVTAAVPSDRDHMRIKKTQRLGQPEEATESEVVLGLFFWILVILLIGSIFFRYFYFLP